jgi:hypothetical protein
VGGQDDGSGTEPYLPLGVEGYNKEWFIKTSSVNFVDTFSTDGKGTIRIYYWNMVRRDTL